MLNVKNAILLFATVYSPLLWVAWLHQLLFLFIIANELLSKNAADVDFELFTALRTIHTSSHSSFLFLGIHLHQKPSLTHSIIGKLKNDLLLILFKRIVESNHKLSAAFEQKSSSKQLKDRFCFVALSSKLLRSVFLWYVTRFDYAIKG